MDNPLNLKDCPRVEFWTDTKWEPYREDIQQEIRGHLATDGADLEVCLEFNIDLDDGDEEWMYTAHVFPQTQVPADIVDPWKNKIMEKAKNENLFTKYSNIWICGHQSHKTNSKIRLIRFHANGDHMEEEGSHEVD